MGEIDVRERALEILEAHNPPTRRHVMMQYVAAFATYLEAEENIQRNGAIVAHPRTGAPIENPYLKVRTAAMNDMRRMAGLKGVDELWGELA